MTSSGNKPGDKTGANNPNRRSALKTILTGGGVITLTALPSQWVKPVVDAVVLPTHAQTSPDTSPAANGFRVTSGEDVQAPGWLDGLFRTAHATVVSIPPGFLCIEAQGENGFMASYEFDRAGTIAAASGKIGGKCVTLSCDEVRGNTVSLEVTSKNADGGFDFELYADSGCEGGSTGLTTTDTPCPVQGKDCSRKEDPQETD